MRITCSNGRIAFALALWLFHAAFLTASDADIQQLTDAVSQAQYTTLQQTIETMGLGRYAGALYAQPARGRALTGTLGDKGNQEARKYLVETFSNIGLAASIQSKFFNVVAEKTGTLTPKNVYIIAAHYDTTKSTVPGGDGDASGVAGVLEAARVLQPYKFDSTIRFIAFNGTDKALRGSNDYVMNVIGIAGEKLMGVLYLDEILHPSHDKKSSLPQALSVGVGDKSPAATAWSSAFAAAAKQFVPALALDPNGVAIDVAHDQFSFVTFQYLNSLRLSENSGKDIANSALDSPADASDGPAGVHYDYGFATNVVRATVALVAQKAGFQGPNDGSTPQFSDSDGDGFSDEIETALGSDLGSAASTPFNLPPALPAGTFEITAAAVSLDFAFGSSDVISIYGTLPVHSGFMLKDAIVIVDVCGVVKSFTLNANGAAAKGANTFAFKLKNPKGPIVEQLAPFSFTLSQGNFKRFFAAHGLTNENAGGAPVKIPITIILNNEVRNAQQLLLYNATKDMIGFAH